MEKISVLIIVPNDKLGGAEQILKSIAKFCYHNNWDITLFCLSKKRSTSWDDFQGRVVFFPFRHFWLGLCVLPFIILRKKYDYVLASQVYINGTLGFIKSLGVNFCKKLVVRESTSVFLRFTGLKKYIFRFFYKLGYKYVDKVVCQTALMKNQILSHYKGALKWKEIVVLANPIDIKYIKYKSAHDVTPYTSDDFIVGAGRLIKAKGFDLLIKAYSSIVETNPSCKLDLLILGDGEERKGLVALVESLGLSHRVLLPGHVENPFPYFKLANMCIVSSRIEGFPNTLMQMMVLNNKVASTRCAGGIESIPGIITCDPTERGIQNAIMQLKDDIMPNNRKVMDRYLEKLNIEQYVLQILR